MSTGKDATYIRVTSRRHTVTIPRSSYESYGSTDGINASSDLPNDSMQLNKTYEGGARTRSTSLPSGGSSSFRPSEMGTCSTPLSHALGRTYGLEDVNRTRDFMANMSWIDLEQSIHELWKRDIDSLEELPPELQLQYLRAWHEDTFCKSILFDHFMSSVKFLVYEYSPDVSLNRSYSPGSLLTNLRSCLASYKDAAVKMEEHLIEVNARIMNRLESGAEKLELHRNSFNVLILGFQERLKYANERTKDALKKNASLQCQLSETLERMKLLEAGQYNAPLSLARLSVDAPAQHPLARRDATFSKKGQKKLYSTFNATFTKDDTATFELSPDDRLQRVIAVSHAMRSNLESQLSQELEFNEYLRSSLMESNEKLAVLDAELTMSEEDSMHKSRLIIAMVGDVVESYEEGIAKCLSASSVNRTFPEEALSSWQGSTNEIIEQKKKEIHSLAQVLIEKEVEFADLSQKLKYKEQKLITWDRELNTLNRYIAEKQAEVEDKETELKALNNALAETQHAIDTTSLELNQKEIKLQELREKLSEKEREISAIEFLRMKVSTESGTSRVESPLGLMNFVSGISRHRTVYSSSDSGEALKTFARLGTVPAISTPVSEQKPDLPYRMVSPEEQPECKKTIILKSPQRDNPLEVNFVVTPSNSGEHIKCGISVKSECDQAMTMNPRFGKPLLSGSSEPRAILQSLRSIPQNYTQDVILTPRINASGKLPRKLFQDTFDSSKNVLKLTKQQQTEGSSPQQTGDSGNKSHVTFQEPLPKYHSTNDDSSHFLSRYADILAKDDRDNGTFSAQQIEEY